MIDLDKLLPKWNCPNCGDWFHMPYKHCMCDFRKMEKELKFSRKVVEAARNYFTEHDLEGLNEKYFKSYHAVKKALNELGGDE